MEDSHSDLTGFQPDRVLNADPFTGLVALSGRFAGQDGDAVVLVARQQLDANALDSHFFSQINTDLQFHNDIYKKFTATPPPEFGKLNVDVIFPATERHINKHSSQKVYVVHETPEMYEAITKKYIDSIPVDRVKWVYNILDGSAEAERRLFHDPDTSTGFVLLPDMKWDQSNTELLYCVGICNRKDVRSIRDLTTEHLPLLKSFRDQGKEVLAEKFDFPEDQLRIFVHYQPSYYHFHVHFASVKVVSGTVTAGKAHLLDDIIDNISLWPDYYQKRTITMTLGENEDLLQLLKKTDRKRKAPTAEPGLQPMV